MSCLLATFRRHDTADIINQAAHNSHAFRPFADTSLVEAQDLAGSKDWPRGLRRGRKKEFGNFSKIQGAKKKKISSQASA